MKPGDVIETPLGPAEVLRLDKDERWIFGRSYPVFTVVVRGLNGLTRVWTAAELAEATNDGR